MEAALVLAAGGIPARLKADPDLAPELKNALDNLVLVFRGRLDKEDTSLAGGIEYEPLFRKALTTDPNSSQAMVGMGRVLLLKSTLTQDRESEDEARAFLSRAIDLQPGDAEAKRLFDLINAPQLQ